MPGVCIFLPPRKKREVALSEAKEMMLAEQSQTWFPTHVQVTVLQARDLNSKGKNGTNDSFTIIQLGKEKYSTSVAEKTLSPVWKEEVSFEFPGLLLQGTPEKYTLHLFVMHRSLVGLDKFLGQVAICLNELFENKSRRQKEWFKLESKPGKKKKRKRSNPSLHPVYTKQHDCEYV